MTRIVALGAGRMGRGIGQVFAYAGYRVDIVDFKARDEAAGPYEVLRAVSWTAGENIPKRAILSRGKNRGIMPRFQARA